MTERASVLTGCVNRVEPSTTAQADSPKGMNPCASTTEGWMQSGIDTRPDKKLSELRGLVSAGVDITIV